eukprot:ANDGO_05145.mRNA.1 Putative AC transposase
MNEKPKTYPYLKPTTDKLRDHLESKHLSDWKAVSSPQSTVAPTISNFFAKPLTNSRKKELREAIVYMICHDIQPLSVVENKGFKQLLELIEPRFQIPDRQHLSQTLLPQIEKEIHDFVGDSLSQDASGVSLTTDGWSSKNGHHFVAVTAHFVNEDFEIVNVLLSCLPSGESTDSLRTSLSKCLEDYGIRHDTVVSVTTDNADVQVNAVVNANLPHLRCFIHTLQLSVQGSLSNRVCDYVVEKAKKIMEFFHRSNKATRELVEYQKRAGVTSPLTIKTECKTRWISLLYALERLLKLKDSIELVLVAIKREDLRMNSVEWSFIESLLPVLRPFEQATRWFSMNQETVASLVIPTVRTLFSLYPDHDERTIRELQANMKTVDKTDVIDASISPLEFIFVDETLDCVGTTSKKARKRKSQCPQTVEAEVSSVTSELCNAALSSIRLSFGNHLRARLKTFLDSSVLDPRIKTGYMPSSESREVERLLCALLRREAGFQLRLQGTILPTLHPRFLKIFGS